MLVKEKDAGKLKALRLVASHEFDWAAGCEDVLGVGDGPAEGIGLIEEYLDALGLVVDGTGLAASAKLLRLPFGEGLSSILRAH